MHSSFERRVANLEQLAVAREVRPAVVRTEHETIEKAWCRQYPGVPLRHDAVVIVLHGIKPSHQFGGILSV